MSLQNNGTVMYSAHSRGLWRGYGWPLVFASLAVHALVFWALPGPSRDAYSPQTEIMLSLITARQQKPVAPDSQPVVEPEPIIAAPAPPRRKNRESKRADTKPPGPQSGQAIPVMADGPVPAIDDDNFTEPFVAGSAPGSEPAAGQAEMSAPLEAETTPEPAAVAAAPETAPEPAVTPPIDIEALLMTYAAGIKREILSRKFYPEAAERLGHTGSAKVGFTIGATGNLESVRIKQSSGYGELDEAALAAVQKAAPFETIPVESGKTSLTMSITLSYRLE